MKYFDELKSMNKKLDSLKRKIHDLLAYISQVLIQGWERLIAQYKKGLIILTDEKSLELFFVRNC